VLGSWGGSYGVSVGGGGVWLVGFLQGGFKDYVEE